MNDFISNLQPSTLYWTNASVSKESLVATVVSYCPKCDVALHSAFAAEMQSILEIINDLESHSDSHHNRDSKVVVVLHQLLTLENTFGFNEASEFQSQILNRLSSAFAAMEGLVCRIQLPPALLIQTHQSIAKRSASHVSCISTADQCVAQTANCSSHGVCVAKPNPASPGTVCYSCSCTLKKWTDDNGKPVKNYDGPVTWTGAACQYQDVSASFNILFFLFVGLTVVIIFVVGLMYDVGDSSGGSSFPPSGRPKTD